MKLRVNSPNFCASRQLPRNFSVQGGHGSGRGRHPGTTAQRGAEPPAVRQIRAGGLCSFFSIARAMEFTFVPDADRRFGGIGIIRERKTYLATIRKKNAFILERPRNGPLMRGRAITVVGSVLSGPCQLVKFVSFLSSPKNVTNSLTLAF